MNGNEGSTQDTGLTMQEATASIASRLFPEPQGEDKTKQVGEGETGEQEVEATDEVDETEGETGEEAESDEVEATEDDEAESEGEEDTAEADETEGDDPRHTVKVDGKDVEIPLSELKAGYSRQADYTRKTQALAKEREEFQPHAEAVREERAQYAQLLPFLKQQIEAAAPENIDWVKRYDEDPIQAARDKLVWDQQRARIAAINAEEKRVQAQIDEENKLKFQDYIKEQQLKLVEKIPAWADPKKANAEQAAIRDHAMKAYGFSQDDLKGIFDHRVAMVLRKAFQFDKLMEKSKGTKPVVPKPKTVTPGAAGTSRQGTDLTRAKQRLAKTGSVQDAASVILQRLK